MADQRANGRRLHIEDQSHQRKTENLITFLLCLNNLPAIKGKQKEREENSDETESKPKETKI